MCGTVCCVFRARTLVRPLFGIYLMIKVRSAGVCDSESSRSWRVFAWWRNVTVTLRSWTAHYCFDMFPYSAATVLPWIAVSEAVLTVPRSRYSTPGMKFGKEPYYLQSECAFWTNSKKDFVACSGCAFILEGPSAGGGGGVRQLTRWPLTRHHRFSASVKLRAVVSLPNY